MAKQKEKRVYKYQVLNELINLKEKPQVQERLNIYLDGLRNLDSHNRLVIFKNPKEKHIATYCTKCKKWHFFDKSCYKNVAQYKKGEKMTCYECESKLEIIYPHNVGDALRRFIYALGYNDRNELIIRVWYFESIYNKHIGFFDEQLYEVGRLNFDQKVALHNNIRTSINGYIYVTKTDNWRKERWEYDYCGSVFGYENCINTSFEIRVIMDHCQKYKYAVLDHVNLMKIDMYDYLCIYEKYPKVEMLVKTRCTTLLKDVCKLNSWHNNINFSMLDKLTKKQLKIVINNNLGLEHVKCMLENKFDDIDLTNKAVDIGYRYRSDINLFGIDIKKTINYIYEQKMKVRDYTDYILWAQQLGYDTTNKHIIYPVNLKEAHDHLMNEKKEKKDIIYNKPIEEFGKALEKLVFKNKEFIIRPAMSQTELIEESVALKHCVRNYADRVAERKTCIMFIRERTDETKPFVTLELQNERVIQCRAENNMRPNNEVVDFVNNWCQKNHFETCFH